MTQPTPPTPEDRAQRNARNGLPLGLVCFVQVAGKTDIYASFDNGLHRPALPYEWAKRGDTPIVAGTAADYTWLTALTKPLIG